MTELWQRHRAWLVLAAIVALAAFMRFYQLDSLPPGLHPDEAANGLDVFKILEQHDWRPFYSTNGGREALFFYLQSIGVMVFGNTILGLRVAPALIGVAATLAVYLWVSSWFNRRSGLIAALLMAVTPWAVTISRDGFRAGMVALMVPLTLWLAAKTYRTRRPLWAILTGISLGLGFYTYIAFRMFPLALIIMVGYLFIFQRGWLSHWWRLLLAAIVAATVVILPMGWYAVEHPGDIIGRPGGVSVFNHDLNHGDVVGTLADSGVKTALMFNFKGDDNYRHNLGSQPELNLFVGIMFLLGIILCLSRLRRLPYLGLLAVFLAMLLPEVLTAESLPHALRAVGALPPALALAAIGTNQMLRQWQSLFPLNRIAQLSGTLAIVFLLILSIYQGYVQYFVAWGSSPNTYGAYAEDSVALANYYNGSQIQAVRYAVAGSYQMQTVEYLTHHKTTYHQMEVKDIDALPLNPAEAREFAFFINDKDEALKHLQLKFPDGQISPHYSNFSGNELFVTYRVAAK
jgi:4-amino-4-deoxy-L-arabinose transferase-like glycosyltransferase